MIGRSCGAFSYCSGGDFVALGRGERSAAASSAFVSRAKRTTTSTNPVKAQAMKVRNSLKSLRARHRNNRLVRRKGRVYIINKTNRRFKARQG